MPIKLIHLSDLHLRVGWAEEQGVVLDSFLSDLRNQIDKPEETYIIFSGDIAQHGSSTDILTYFTESLGTAFLKIGFKPENMIYVPGNHDLNREYVKENFTTLKSLQERDVSETDFNTIIYGEIKNIILPKFKNFLDWQSKTSSLNLDEDSFCGKGFALTDDIGIYCLNTALYSFGGLEDKGVSIDDRGNW